MSTLTTIKRLAADIMDVGRNRVRIKNELSEGEKKQLMEAITRANIKDLIRDKIIFAKEKKGKKKKEKRKRTTGNRMGGAHAKISSKEKWIIRIRALRKYLNKLIGEGELDSEYKRIIYLKIKGNSFRNKAAMYAYLKDNKLLNEKLKNVEKKEIPAGEL